MFLPTCSPCSVQSPPGTTGITSLTVFQYFTLHPWLLPNCQLYFFIPSPSHPAPNALPSGNRQFLLSVFESGSVCSLILCFTFYI